LLKIWFCCACSLFISWERRLVNSKSWPRNMKLPWYFCLHSVALRWLVWLISS
jgi:hypothetical protein